MQRNLSLDIFRFVAAFFVICIHAPFLTWGLNPLFKCAVPFFCILTGFYLKCDKVNPDEFKRQIKKYVEILLLTVLVYAGFYYFENRTIEFPGFTSLLLYNSFGFINAPHLWYILALIQSLVLIQILRRHNAIKLIYIFIPLIVISPLGKYNIEPFSTLISHYDANWILTMLPYMAIGVLIRELQVGGGKYKYLYYILTILFLLISLVESKVFGTHLSHKSAFYFGTPLFSISLFLSILSMNIRTTDNLVIISKFCKYSAFHIYIWHFLIINLLKHYLFYDSLQPFVAVFVLTLLISLSYLSKKYYAKT